jgi:hypothetical protein
MHNTQIKKSLNKKMCTRYIGPLIVISRNYGSAYILSELDGTVLHHPIAAFHLLVRGHQSISLPYLLYSLPLTPTPPCAYVHPLPPLYQYQ